MFISENVIIEAGVILKKLEKGLLNLSELKSFLVKVETGELKRKKGNNKLEDLMQKHMQNLDRPTQKRRL